MIYAGLVSFDQILSYHPLLERLSPTLIEEYRAKAYWDVVKKLTLKPVVLSLVFGEPSNFSILGDYIESEYGEVWFKEISDIHCNDIKYEPFDSEVAKPTLLPSVVEPTGKCHWDGRLLYGEGIINIIGYIYPVWSEEEVSPCLLYPMIAMMYYWLHRDKGNENEASMYELVATKYINLYNKNVVSYKNTNLKQSVRGNPYEL